MKLVYVLLIAIALGGCSTINESPALASVVVKSATLKVIEDADFPSYRAERVVRYATQAKDLLSGGPQTTVSALAAAVRASIQWDELETSDKLLVDGLIAFIQEELEQRVSKGMLDADQQLAVSKVLDWVIEAAAMVN